MLKNKWITYAVIVFFIYSFIKGQLNSKPVHNYNPGDYPEIVKQKNTSEIERQTQEIGAISSTDSSTKKNAIANIEIPQEAGILQKKIIGFANQLINGPIGQKIAEGILISSQKNLNNSTPSPYYNLTKNDLIEGDGEKVKCGQNVKAHTTIKLSDGTVYLNTHLNKKPLSFTVGQEEVIRGLEYNVIGMAKEGYRKVFIPPSQAYDNPKFSTRQIVEGEFVNLEIELLSIFPLIDKKIDKISTVSSTLNSYQDIYRCGDKARFLYKIRNNHNNIVYYSSNRNNISSGRIGYKNFPYILTWALEAMPLESKKTIIFPTEMLKNIYGENTDFFQPITNLPDSLTLELETLKRK